jgi:flagellar hook assembly protein FlgD
VFFTLNSQATVTLKIVSEKTPGTPVYQMPQVAAAAGAYSFVWDGKKNDDMTVPDEAYLYILEASDGVRTDAYSRPTPTGTGTVTCSQSTGMSPLKNIPMTITYTPAQPSRVSLSIVWSSQTFTILNEFPALTATQSFVWEGRNPNNKLLDLGARAYCTVASMLPENYLITSGDAVEITDVKTDPYIMSLAYGQFTHITYATSQDANVSISLTSPSGMVISLLTNQFKSAGPQEFTWNGLDAADTTGKATLITEEGDYMVTVQAVNPATGTSRIAKANVKIGF